MSDGPSEPRPDAGQARPARASKPAGGKRSRLRQPGNTPARVVRRAMSAGGVVYRERDGHIEIVLVARPKQHLWALPKGTPEPGESVQQTAIREVGEETGLEVEIVAEVGSIRYRYTIPSEGVLVQKVVHHFLFVQTGGDVERHDHEYDVVEWLDIHEAVGRMSYANERSIVERAAAVIADLQRGGLEEAGA